MNSSLTTTSKTVDVVTAGLSRILEKRRNERVVVVGTTCTGKSTLIGKILAAQDMDELIFPKLTAAEREFVCQTPWTEEIGRAMSRWVRERVVVEPGKPIFGTVVIQSDLVILLRISDELLQSRTAARGVKFADAKAMQNQLIREVQVSGIPFIEYPVG